VSNRHDRVGVRDRVVGQRETPDLLGGAGVLACEVEHRRGGVGGDHAMAGVDEMLRQQPAPTAELDDEALARTNGLEQREDARRAVFSMEGEPLVMDPRQIGAVVRSALGSHRPMVPHAHLSG
jgi:hypothetical protein